MAATTEIPFSEGRGGLKVPELTWGDWSPEVNNNVLWYFHDFWSVNGLPPHHPDTSRNRVHDKAYSNELVVPVNAHKPLVYIRGRFQPRDPRLIELEEHQRGNPQYELEDGGWPSYSPVTTAVEEHSVATPPDEVGKFDVLLRVRKTHVTDESADEGLTVVYRGRRVDEEDYYPEGFRTMTLSEANLAQSAAYKSALQFILHAAFINYIK